MKKQIVITGATAIGAIAAVVAGAVIATSSTDSSDVASAVGTTRVKPANGSSYPANAAGQTYGSLAGVSSFLSAPTLVEAVASNGARGYVLSSQLFDDAPRDLAEARELTKNPSGPRAISVYAVDGKTVIGEYVISQGVSG